MRLFAFFLPLLAYTAPIEPSLFSAIPCQTPTCQPDGMVWTADVSLLAWQALEEGLDFALKNQPTAIQDVNIQGSLIRPDFSWEPAFKLNLGMGFSKRAWDTLFRWTYFHTSPSKTVHATTQPDTTGIFPLWVIPNAKITTQFLYSDAKSSLTLNFNSVDIEMGYHPFLSEQFSLRFLAGLKVASIHQKFHLHYTGGWSDGATRLLDAFTKLSNASIGAGPRIGFLSEWWLGRGFYLLGSIAGSLPLWHYRVHRTDLDQNIQNNSLQTLQSAYHNRFWTFRSVLETAVGIGWNTCFGCNRPFGVCAQYELQYYAEQNMMPMLINAGLINQTFFPQGDLIFHGANLTFHLGF